MKKFILLFIYLLLLSSCNNALSLLEPGLITPTWLRGQYYQNTEYKNVFFEITKTRIYKGNEEYIFKKMDVVSPNVFQVELKKVSLKINDSYKESTDIQKMEIYKEKENQIRIGKESGIDEGIYYKK